MHDFRRLIVSPIPRSPFSTGLWHPVVGSDGSWHPSMGPGAIPQVVSHDDIGLPDDLAEEFQAWVEWLTKAGQTGDDFPLEAYKARGRALAEGLAEFVGDRYQVEYDSKRIIPGLAVEPLSRGFIFGKQYAELRNKWDFTTPFYRTYLASLLWRQMTQEDRGRLFPGVFDLGNKKAVPAEQCTYAALARELTDELRVIIGAETHPFRSIEDGVEGITHRKLGNYLSRNPSTTLKVVKLLYWMQKQRHSRLFHFLTMPDVKRYSLEMRELTPFVKNEISTEEAVWLLADLKTYLGLELEEQGFIAIQLTFWPILDLVDKLRQRVSEVLAETYGSDYHTKKEAYGVLSKAVESFEFDVSNRDMTLDEELCIHAQSLEFFHFAVGMPELFIKAIPDLPITSIREEIWKFTERIAKEKGMHRLRKVHVPILSISEVPAFLMQHKVELLALMNKAIKEVASWSDLTDEIIADAHGLVHNFFWFLRPIYWSEVDMESKRVSPWLCLGALCCAWHAKKHPPTQHAPYWRLMPEKEGLKTARPTSSLRTALRDSIHDQVASDRMVLEHRHIWRSRLEWFCDSLNGQGELVVPAFQYRVSVVMKLMEIFNRTRNIEGQLDAVYGFYRYMRKKALEMHRKHIGT